MNAEKQKQQKLEKWGRQIGYTALKLINLSGKDMTQIKGNGLIITIKRWTDDKSFEEQITKIREGWKK